MSTTLDPILSEWTEQFDPGANVDWRKGGWRKDVPKFLANKWLFLSPTERAIVFYMATEDKPGAEQ
jgi:hypothetical protein